MIIYQAWCRSKKYDVLFSPFKAMFKHLKKKEEKCNNVNKNNKLNLKTISKSANELY